MNKFSLRFTTDKAAWDWVTDLVKRLRNTSLISRVQSCYTVWWGVVYKTLCKTWSICQRENSKDNKKQKRASNLPAGCSMQ